jgi:hypothetical protein
MAHTTYTTSHRHCPRPRRHHRPYRSRREPEAGPPQGYDRRTELARILPLWPHELDDETPQGRHRIVSKLQRALRMERRRGVAGHWTYDLGRHVELLRVYRHELALGGLPELTNCAECATSMPNRPKA